MAVPTHEEVLKKLGLMPTKVSAPSTTQKSSVPTHDQVLKTIKQGSQPTAFASKLNLPPAPAKASSSPYFAAVDKGGSYGFSETEKDTSGKPLFAYRKPGDKATTTDKQRVATTFDPRTPSKVVRDDFYNPRAEGLRDAFKKSMGIAYSDELDHKIALALSGSNQKENLRPIPKEKNNDSAIIMDLQQKVIDGKMSLFDAQVELAKKKGLPLPFTGEKEKKTFLDNLNEFMKDQNPGGIIKNTIKGLPAAASELLTLPEAKAAEIPTHDQVIQTLQSKKMSPINQYRFDNATKQAEKLKKESDFANNPLVIGGKAVLGLPKAAFYDVPKALYDMEFHPDESQKDFESNLDVSKSDPITKYVAKPVFQATTRFFRPIFQAYADDVAQGFAAQEAFDQGVLSVKQVEDLFPALKKTKLQIAGDVLNTAAAIYFPNVFAKGVAGATEMGVKQAFLEGAKRSIPMATVFSTGSVLSSGTKDPAEAAGMFSTSFLGLVMLGGISHAASPATKAAWQKATKDIIETHNLPKSVFIKPGDIKDFTTAEQSTMINDLGLTNAQYIKAFKNGLTIDLPLEKVVSSVDKPWFAKAKAAFGFKPSEPNVISKNYVPVDGKTGPTEGVRGLIEAPKSSDITPYQVVDSHIKTAKQVLDNPDAPQILGKHPKKYLTEVQTEIVDGLNHTAGKDFKAQAKAVAALDPQSFGSIEEFSKAVHNAVSEVTLPANISGQVKKLIKDPSSITLYRGETTKGGEHFSTEKWAENFGDHVVRGKLPKGAIVHVITPEDMQTAYNAGIQGSGAISDEAALYNYLFDRYKADALIGHDSLNSKALDVVVNPKHLGEFKAVNGAKPAISGEPIAPAMAAGALPAPKAPEAPAPAGVPKHEDILKAIGKKPVAPKSPAKEAVKEPEEKKNDNSLLVVHNLSESKLMFADRVGGLANPSTAVVNPKLTSFESYGDISLIGDKHLIEGEKTHLADAYSPRFPSVHSSLTSEDFKRLRNDLDPYFKKIGPGVRDLYHDDTDMIRQIENNTAVMLKFMEREGVKPSSEGQHYYMTQIQKLGLESKYQKYLNDLYKEYNLKEQMFAGYTYSGKRRYKPVSVEEASKIMSKQKEEGYNYGLGSYRSKIAPIKRSAPQIKKEAGRLVSKEQFEIIKEAHDNELWGLKNKLEKYAKIYNSNSFIEGDQQLNTIGNVLAGDRDAMVYFNTKFPNAPESLKKEVFAFKEKLKKMSTEYFETKFKRPVGLREFKIALVPENISKDAIDILEKNGLHVVKYKKGEKAKAMEELLKSDVAFSRRPGVMSGLKGNPLTLKEVEKMINEEVGEDKVKLFFKDDLIEGVGDGRYRSVRDAMKGILRPAIELYQNNGHVSSFTALHETAHYLFDNLLTKAQKREFLDIAKKRMSIFRKANYLAKGYRGSDSIAEEWIADNWAKARAKEKGFYTGPLSRIFQALDKLMKEIIEAFNKVKELVKKMTGPEGRKGFAKNPFAEEPKKTIEEKLSVQQKGMKELSLKVAKEHNVSITRDGNLELYHGTKEGRAPKEGGDWRIGTYFTSDPKVAEQFANLGEGGDVKIMKVEVPPHTIFPSGDGTYYTLNEEIPIVKAKPKEVGKITMGGKEISVRKGGDIELPEGPIKVDYREAERAQKDIQKITTRTSKINRENAALFPLKQKLEEIKMQKSFTQDFGGEMENAYQKFVKFAKSPEFRNSKELISSAEVDTINAAATRKGVPYRFESFDGMTDEDQLAMFRKRFEAEDPKSLYGRKTARNLGIFSKAREIDAEQRAIQKEIAQKKLEQKDERSLSHFLKSSKSAKEIERMAAEKAKNEKIKGEIVKTNERIKGEMEREKAFEEKIRKAHFEAQKKKGFFGKIQQVLRPVESFDPKTKEITENWFKDLLLAKEKGQTAYEEAYPKGPQVMSEVHEYQAGKQTAYIRNTFDEMGTDFKRRGLEFEWWNDQYIPQVWMENSDFIGAAQRYLAKKGMTPEEIASYMAGEPIPEEKAIRLKIRPNFTKDRFWPDYKTGMEHGLKPKYRSPAQLIGHYKENGERALANKKYISELKQEAKLIPSEDAPDTWISVTKLFSKEPLSAAPELANMINGRFRDEANLSLTASFKRVVAGAARFMFDLKTMSGLPYSTINSFAMGQAIKLGASVFGDLATLDFNSAVSDLKGMYTFIRANSDAASIKFFEENKPYITMAASEGFDLFNRPGHYENVHRKVSDYFIEPKAGSGLFKRGVRHTKNAALAFGIKFKEAFVQKTTTNMLSMASLQTFKDVYNSVKKAGMEDQAAIKFAVQVTKKFNGITGELGRGLETKDSLNAAFTAPYFRESVLNTLWNAGKGWSTEWGNAEFYKSRRLLLGMIVMYALYNALNYELNGNFMWDNPPGREWQLRFKIDDENVGYTDFMPSFFAIARNLGSAGINLFKGNFDVSLQKVGTVFSTPIQLTTELFANKDYFGRPIYKDTDSTQEKLKKLAIFTGLSLTHPYLLEMEKYLTGQQPFYQAFSRMAEFPLKFSTLTNEQKSKYYDMLDEQTQKRADAKAKLLPIYEKNQALKAEGKLAEATEIYDALSESEKTLYNQLKADIKRKETNSRKASLQALYDTNQKLIKDGRIDQATEIFNALSEEDRRIYGLIKAAAKRNADF